MPPALGFASKFVAVWSLFALPWIGLWKLFEELGGWPSNDDPFYAKSLAIWSAEGEWRWVRQAGELTASSVGHQALGWLVTKRNAFSYRSLFLVCIAQQSLACCCLFFASRMLGVSLGGAVLLGLTLLFSPLYFGHAFTFMTDGPATAWIVIGSSCMMVGALRGKTLWMLAGSLSLGWSYWFRQTGALLLAAPLCAQLMHLVLCKDLAAKRFALFFASIVPAVLLIVGFEFSGLFSPSSSRLKDVAPGIDAAYWKEVLVAAYGGVLIVGWFMLPWLWGAVQSMILHMCRSSARRLAAAHACALSLLFIGLTPWIATCGNACLTNSTGTFVQNAHFGPIFLSDMDEPGRWSQLGGVEWPLAYWKTLSLLAIVSCAVVVWWVVAIHWCIEPKGEREGHSQATESVRVHAYSVGFVASLIAGAGMLVVLIEPHLDRYWLFVLAALLMAWIHVVRSSAWKRTASSVAWASLCIAMNAGMATVFTHDMLAWNNVRWRFVESHLKQGLLAEQIDGGRDVNAWLRLDEDTDSMPRTGDTSKWWSGRAERAIAVGQRPGWHEVERLPWFSWATGREHHLLVLERDFDRRGRD